MYPPIPGNRNQWYRKTLHNTLSVLKHTETANLAPLLRPGVCRNPGLMIHRIRRNTKVKPEPAPWEMVPTITVQPWNPVCNHPVRLCLLWYTFFLLLSSTFLLFITHNFLLQRPAVEIACPDCYISTGQMPSGHYVSARSAQRVRRPVWTVTFLPITHPFLPSFRLTWPIIGGRIISV